MNFDQALSAVLIERKAQKRYRRHRIVEVSGRYKSLEGKRLLSFCSNDYLGLSQHPRLIDTVRNISKCSGVGSGASHLVDGHTREHHALEEALADFCGRDRALVFSSGYMANIGVIAALLGDHMPGTSTLIQDKLNHASLIDAARLISSKCVRYRHNSIDHLAARLSHADTDRKLIAVDGVFSMDGDLAILNDIAPLARTHQAWVMVDDAHGIGCLGERGRGSLEHFGLSQQDVPVLMGTFGKALGSAGAFVAGSEALIEALIQFSRTYIYTTALPPAIASAARVSLELIDKESWRREHLMARIAQFQSGVASILSSVNLVFAEQASASLLRLLPSFTAIQPLVVGEEALAVKVADLLESRGYLVSAIRPPTVPLGTSRLRFTLSAAHTTDDVEGLLNALYDTLMSAVTKGLAL